MHKVGYPNLNAGYSEEDSRDAADNHRDNMEITHRVTRKSNKLKNSKYLYDYEEEDMTPRRQRGVPIRSKKEIRPRRESNDKENKKDIIVNGKTNGRLRSSKNESESKTKDNMSENEDEEFSENRENAEEDIEEAEVNGNAGKSFVIYIAKMDTVYSIFR